MSVLPTSQLERWKYSNLPSFVTKEYNEQPLSVGYDGDDAFVVSDDADMTIWAQAVYQDMDLWDGAQDVLNLNIPAGTQLDTPISLSLSVENDDQENGHIGVTIGEGASVTIIEHIDVQGWCNRSMTIHLEKDAKLTHIRTANGAGLITNLTQISQDTHSHYNGYVLHNGGQAFVRDQIHAKLIGEDVKCDLGGAKLLSDKDHVDSCILIEHMAPDCYSNQNYRNVLGGQSCGVFQGKVHVHQVAQKTDGYQLCNSILLSDKAEMDTKPELEIYADDVQCSHGATTASLDEEPLFYLQARGIDKATAQSMLLEGFIMESLEALEDDEDICERLRQQMNERLKSVG